MGIQSFEKLVKVNNKAHMNSIETNQELIKRVWL